MPISPQPAVLSVESHSDTAQLLSCLFSLEGISCFSADSYEEGLTLIETVRPDLYLINDLLPGGDGYEFAARVRSADPDAPFIITSADARPGAARRALAVGAHAFFFKPYETPELLRVVRQLLHERQDC